MHVDISKLSIICFLNKFGEWNTACSPENNSFGKLEKNYYGSMQEPVIIETVTLFYTLNEQSQLPYSNAKNIQKLDHLLSHEWGW